MNPTAMGGILSGKPPLRQTWVLSATVVMILWRFTPELIGIKGLTGVTADWQQIKFWSKMVIVYCSVLTGTRKLLLPEIITLDVDTDDKLVIVIFRYPVVLMVYCKGELTCPPTKLTDLRIKMVAVGVTMGAITREKDVKEGVVKEMATVLASLALLLVRVIVGNPIVRGVQSSKLICIA